MKTVRPAETIYHTSDDWWHLLQGDDGVLYLLFNCEASFVSFGRIDEISALAHQSPGSSVRTSIVSSGLPSKYSYGGSWAKATTEKLGRVEFQASVDAGPACKLLALHVHRYFK
jgi:hypothetical protein